MKCRISKYCKLQNISRGTVYNWEKRGVISLETDKQGRVWVIDNSLNDEDNSTQKELSTVIYLRVGVYRSKSLLDDQEKRLIGYCQAKGYKVSKVVKEVSPITSQSTPTKLMNLLLDKSVDRVVVDTADKVSLFGCDIIEKLLDLNGRKLEVINQSSPLDPSEREKSVHHLILWSLSEMYGKRKAGSLMKEILGVINKK